MLALPLTGNITTKARQIGEMEAISEEDRKNPGHTNLLGQEHTSTFPLVLNPNTGDQANFSNLQPDQQMAATELSQNVSL